MGVCGRYLFPFCTYLILAISLVTASAAAGTRQQNVTVTSGPTKPFTVMLDPDTLVTVRSLYENPSTRGRVAPRVRLLLKYADDYLKRSTVEKWAVTNKSKQLLRQLENTTASKFDTHEYVSWPPYWWPRADAPCLKSKTGPSTSSLEKHLNSVLSIRDGDFGSLTGGQEVRCLGF
jgi:hypothetical protein